MKIIVLSLCLAALLFACGHTEKAAPEAVGSLPTHIRAFENDAFVALLTVSYNGSAIDNLTVADENDNIVVFASPQISRDSSFICQWSWRERRFSGVRHRLNAYSVRTIFDHSAPVSTIIEAYDNNGHLGQVLYRAEQDTVELVDYSFIGDLPVSCAVLDPADYSRPGGSITWQYDDFQRPITILFTDGEKHIRLEVEYDRDGSMRKGVWEQVENCAWLPMPVWVERLGL